jgi:hypothetical protein
MKNSEPSSLSAEFEILHSSFFIRAESETGAVAQLGEHLLCKQGVVGSIPSSSTNFVPCLVVPDPAADKKGEAARQTVSVNPLRDSGSALVFATWSSLTIEYGL